MLPAIEKMSGYSGGFFIKLGAYMKEVTDLKARMSDCATKTTGSLFATFVGKLYFLCKGKVQGLKTITPLY